MTDAFPQPYAAPDLDTVDIAASAARAAEGCDGLDPRAQADRLAGDGLLGILAGEGAGGLGLPLGYALPVMEAVAPALLGFPLAETMLLARALENTDPGLATALCEGRSTGTIAWRSDAGLGPEGGLAGRARAPGLDGVDWVLVPTRDGRAALVETARLAIRSRDDLDPSRPQILVVLDGAVVGQDRILDDAALRRLRDDALLLRCASIAGSAARCLDLAVEHASTRSQFGKPLVSNQALRHNLARQKLLLESMRAAVRRAAILEGEPAGRIARLAAFASAAAGGAAIAESAIQVFGGMGYTWEVPLHRHLRRIKAIAAEADAPSLAEELASAFMAGIEPASEPKDRA